MQVNSGELPPRRRTGDQKTNFQPNGHGAKFTRKKEEAIAAWLTQRNVEAASAGTCSSRYGFANPAGFRYTARSDSHTFTRFRSNRPVHLQFSQAHVSDPFLTRQRLR